MAYQFTKLNKGSAAIYSSGGYGFFKLSKSDGGSGAVDFATDAWEVVSAEAQRIALAGSTSGSPYSVGDERTITLSTNEQIKVAIMGFNHDNLTTAYANGATKAGITIGMCDCLLTAAQMNSLNTNVGGWGGSAMRSNMATYFSQLPSALQGVIKPSNKLTSAGNLSPTIVTTSDSLWLFSFQEVMGTYFNQVDNQLTYPGEGTQYQYFLNSTIPAEFAPVVAGATTGSFVGNGIIYTNKFGEQKTTTNNFYYNYESVKGLGNAPHISHNWWWRSPHLGNSNNFADSHNGGGFAQGAALSLGVSFGFCL